MSHRLILFSLVLLLLLSGTAVGEEGGESSVSMIPRRCGVCHLERVEQAIAGPFSFLSSRRPSAAGEEEMCYSCHNGLVRDSRRGIWTGRQHRSDGVFAEPERGVRASCGNCHDPHVQTGGLGTFMRYGKGYFAHCLKCHPGQGREKRRNHPVSSGAGKAGDKDLPDCFSCHTVHRASGPSLIRRGTAGVLCSSCHGENPSVKGQGPGSSSHIVASDGPLCRTCHAVHEAPGEKLLRKAAETGLLCLDCHGDRSSPSYREGNHPVDSQEVGCLSCHRVHNAAALGKKGGLLAQPAHSLNSTCSLCHEETFSPGTPWNHPVNVEIREPNRVRLEKLSDYGSIMGEDVRVQCLSCHKAHGAVKDTAGLVVRAQALCLYCHGEQNSLAPNNANFGTHPISVSPKNASVASTFLDAGGITGAGGELVCLTCHRSHGGDKGLVLPRGEYSCTLCHTGMEGLAKGPHGSPGTAEGPEKARDPCLACHGTHGWKAVLEDTGMGGSAIEKACWHCHGPNGEAPMRGYFGHTIGAPPARGTGGRDLPLFLNDGRRYRSGIITCATCHDVHGDSREYSLRLEPGEKRSALCLGCHPRKEAVSGTKHDISLYFPREKNRLGEAAGKTGTCGSCHLAHSSGLGDSWAREVESDPTQFGMSFPFCSTCHGEGSLAQGKTVAERSHPPPSFVSQNPEAKAVDCDGCHDPHTWNPFDSSDKGDFFVPGDNSTSFLLSPGSGRSPLCLKCHPKKVGVVGTRHDFSDIAGADGGGRNTGLCERCHLPHGGQEHLMWPSAFASEESYGSEACTQCHQGKREDLEKGSDHPIGVTPGPRAGNEFPLYLPSGRKYFQGNVSCGTCHDPHSWSPVKEGPSSEEATAATSFLRMEADGYSPLCFPCHADRALVVGTDHDLRVTAPETVNPDGQTTEESGVCGTCHSVHGARHQPFLWNRDEGEGQEPQSRYCRSCHDEGGLKEAKLPPRLETHFVSYPGKGMISRFITARRSRFVGGSRSLALYDTEGEVTSRGHISCATCHDAHRWEAETTRSGQGIPLEGDSGNSFLKERSTFAVGGAFCKECHQDDSLEMYRRYHFPDGEPAGEK